jgi:hypothetical protein
LRDQARQSLLWALANARMQFEEKAVLSEKIQQGCLNFSAAVEE